MHAKDADRIANSVDPDQTEQSELGLLCLPRRTYPKTLDTWKICCNQQVMQPKDEIANSVDPGQTSPLEAVGSGSALFAQAYLSENFGYRKNYCNQWRVKHPKDADRIANSVDPDQTAPRSL